MAKATTKRPTRKAKGRGRSDGSARSTPAGLSPGQIARLLRVPAEAVRSHIEAGAPVAPDRRINLVHYAAWLVRQLARGEQQR